MEAGLKASDLSCQTYSKVNPVTSAPAPTTTTVLGTGSSTTVGAGVTTTTTGLVYTVSTDNPTVQFQFSQQADATQAKSVLSQYKQVCLIGQGEGLVNEAMVLEPFVSGAPTQVPGTEKCVRYNNGALQTAPDQSGLGWWVQDTSATPPNLRRFSSKPDADIGLTVARAHSNHCWIGGGSTFSSLAGSNLSILEYWR
jgi:hypothetical protein